MFGAGTLADISHFFLFFFLTYFLSFFLSLFPSFLLSAFISFLLCVGGAPHLCLQLPSPLLLLLSFCATFFSFFLFFSFPFYLFFLFKFSNILEGIVFFNISTKTTKLGKKNTLFVVVNNLFVGAKTSFNRSLKRFFISGPPVRFLFWLSWRAFSLQSGSYEAFFLLSPLELCGVDPPRCQQLSTARLEFIPQIFRTCRRFEDLEVVHPQVGAGDLPPPP